MPLLKVSYQIPKEKLSFILISFHFQIGEARALYNLGNVYHAKGKHLGRSRHRDPGDFPFEVQQALSRAVEFYE